MLEKIYSFLGIDLAAVAIKLLLKSQDAIRIVITGAPNYGDQVANINLIKQLIYLGYKGTIEIIYSHNAKEKIIKLFDISESSLTGYFYNNSTYLKFMAFQEFSEKYQKGEIKRLSFGFSGAHVYTTLMEEIKSVTLSESIKYLSKDLNPDETFTNEERIAILSAVGNEMQDNRANWLNVDIFVNLSPTPPLALNPMAESYGGTNTRQQYATHIWYRDTLPQEIEEKSEYKINVFPVTTLEETKKYLRLTNSGKKIMNTTSALMPLIDRIENQSINVWPIYGKTVQEVEINLLTFITAGRYAQLQNYDSVIKPLFLLVFSEMSDWIINNLLETIQNCNPRQTSHKFCEVIKELNLSNHFKIEKLNQISPSYFSGQEKNEVFVLAMGELPNVIFDGLFTFNQSNVFPPVREGWNSFNILALTGRHYFHCDWDMLKLEILDNNPASLFAELENDMCRLTFEKWNNGIHKLIGEKIIESKIPYSQFATYFKNLQAYALYPFNDRLKSALGKIIGEELSEAFENGFNYQFAFSLMDNSLKAIAHRKGISENSAEYLSILFKLSFFLYMGNYFSVGITGTSLLLKICGYHQGKTQTALNVISSGFTAYSNFSWWGTAKVLTGIMGSATGNLVSYNLCKFSLWAVKKVSDKFLPLRHASDIKSTVDKKSLKIQ